MACERSVDVAAASGTLHVTLLGGFSVRVGSRAVPGSWRLRKSKTLVKLLALAGGHRAHRDVIAGVLWPGLGPAAAANNLHQALHAARRDRFYAFIQYEREAAGLPAPTLEGVAKLALLAVRYPHLLSALGEDVEQDGADRCLLSVPETAENEADWAEKAQFAPAHVRSEMETADLRNLVQRPLVVGTVAAGFL